MNNDIPQIEVPLIPEPEPIKTPPTIKERLAKIAGHPFAPILAFVGLLVFLGGFVLLRASPTLAPYFHHPAIVVFDPVRFINAQRSIASILAINPNAEQALILSQVGKQAEVVIREEAHGALVLVKQAVVAPEDYLDITTAVLERFNLPTNVPTVTNRVGEQLEDVAPTDAAFSAGKLREDYRLELQQRSMKLQSEADTAKRQGDLTP